MPRLKGTITIALTEDETDLVALKGVTLTYDVAGNDHANIADLSRAASSPEIVSWSITGSVNYVTDESGYVDASHALLETLAIERTEFTAHFTTPSGVLLYGLCFVSDLRTLSSDEQVFGFDFVLAGSGELVDLTAVEGSLDWCPLWTGYFRIYGSYANIFLGFDPGWVKIIRTNGAPDDITVKDGFGNSLHTAGPQFWKDVDGTFFYWDPDPDDSPVIHIENTWDGVPAYPAWSGTIYCPGVEEPTT